MMTIRTFLPLILFLAAVDVRAVGSGAQSLSAKQLADTLSTNLEGTSNVRLKMEVKASAEGPSKSVLQLQIKQRRTAERADLVYQVLFPVERKGEAVLLHQSTGHAASGWLVIPPNKPAALDASQMTGSLLGSNLSYEDAIENVFAWKNQSLVGNETVDRVDCVILESKPGEGDHSNYARARSWIDLRRLVPLRVEKYLASGQLARRIDTTRVASDDQGHPLPANLTVRSEAAGSFTELDGSRITHDVKYSNADFTPEGMTALLTAHPADQ